MSRLSKNAAVRLRHSWRYGVLVRLGHVAMSESSGDIAPYLNLIVIAEFWGCVCLQFVSIDCDSA